MNISPEEVRRQILSITGDYYDTHPVITLDRNKPDSPLQVSYQKERSTEGINLLGKLGTRTQWLLKNLGWEIYEKPRRMFDCQGVAWVVSGLEDVKRLDDEGFIGVYREHELIPCPQRPYASPINPTLVHLVKKEAFRNIQNPHTLLEKGCVHSAVLVGHIEDIDVHIEKRGKGDVKVSTLRQMREAYSARPELDLIELYMPVSRVLDAVR
ncbi:hypothetical protein GOV07_04900 [Candidatus Woesearchaeota archaeon]|nr:hypothetical protein [Candidatus Woesearchaeota archaeon]